MPLRKKHETPLVELENCRDRDYIFMDDNRDRSEIQHAKISLSMFLRIGMKDSKFNNCSFTQTEFRDCYFRRCKFNLVDFTGSTFYDCNFEKAVFTNCDLKYARFFNCSIDYDGVIQSLPSIKEQPNLRLLLARNLRVNALQLGDKQLADLFLETSMEAEESLLKAIVRGDTPYYRNEYDFFKRLSALLSFFGLWFSKVVWGYGYKLSRIFSTFIVISLILTITSYTRGFEYIVAGKKQELDLVKTYLYYITALVTSSSPDVVPASMITSIFSTGSSFVGAVFLAVLAAALYQKISRR